MIPESIEHLVKILERREIEWEVYWEIGRNGSFVIENGKIKRAQRRFYSGIGVRTALDEKVSFSYLTGLSHSKNELQKFVDEVLTLLKVSEIPFYGFPERKRFKKVKGRYDPEIESIPFEEAYQIALDVSKEIAMKNVNSTSTLSLSFLQRGILNSNGVEGFEKATTMAFRVTFTKGRASGSKFQTFTQLSLNEIPKIIEDARKELELSQQALKVKKVKGEVLISEEVMAELLRILMPNLYADNVFHGQSKFTSIGEAVGGQFELIDDATIPNSPGSYSFDGEGNPGSKTVLIRDGIIRGVLTDETYGKLLKIGSTGNGLRNFRNPPIIASSNLVLKGYGTPVGDISILKAFGTDLSNPITGEFSLTIELGLLKDGSPFRGGLLTGNIFDLIREIEVGREVKRIGSLHVSKASSKSVRVVA